MSGRTNKNGIDRYGFTIGIELEWSVVFLGICGLGFAAVIFWVGVAWGVGVIAK
jgi:hypothetical protein